ncbi:hypothetical protein FS749_015865 [Ceratobasidium sp. UAMH 11750]|nr:hypothetical protein FS749_015865 [Ceratobasidium sp. UAMH 11750]
MNRCQFKTEAEGRVPPEATEFELVQSDSTGGTLVLTRPNYPQERAQVIISRNTPLHEIIEHLTSSGCRDLTDQIDPLSLSDYPVSWGGFGDVYCGALHDQRKVAIKALRVSLGSEDELGKIPKRAARELYTWSKCNHPNVLPLLGLVEFQGQIRMISLWLKNGSLPAYLDKHPSVDRCSMSAQVCKGLEYLHDEVNMVHGDLKGMSIMDTPFVFGLPGLQQQNILVSNDGMPMITDFGNAVLQRGTLMFTETKNAPQFTPRWTVGLVSAK